MNYELKKLLNISYSLLVIGYLLFTPFTADAALWIGGPDQLVPDCGTQITGGMTLPKPCGLCQFLTLGQNIIGFLTFTIAPALVIIMVAWGGITLLVSGGSEELRKKGKDIITTGLWGYAIVLLSWLAIDTIIVLFADPAVINPEQWFQISC